MKSQMKSLIIAATLLLTACSPAADTSAQSLNDLLGKASGLLGGGDGIVSDLIDGAFTKDKLTLEDIAGTWQSTGSAVNFRSESLLKKAGGAAAASAIEKKIDPYFQKYGLNKSVVTIDREGNIAITFGRNTLKGTIVPNTAKDDLGNFIVNFKALGVMSLGDTETFVSLTNNPLNGHKQLNIMFDAQKMVAIMKTIAAISKSNLANQAVSAMESYDGICIGFRCSSTTGNK